MIKSITVTNHLGESIELELGYPEKSGFLVQGVDGLGPSKANINCTEVATADGALYNSARVNARNIVLKLKLLWKPTVEDTRQLSYKYFPLKKQIQLLIKTDNRTSVVSGYVESNEPNIFTSSETTQISIVCPDPYFYSTTNSVTVFSGIDAGFSFPFSNESLTENLIEFGSIKKDTVQNIVYSGDADVGMVFTIHSLGAAKNLTIYNVETREVMKINTDRFVGATIMASDDIIISTVKGNKYAVLLRGGVYTNILNCLDKNTDWFQLSKGDNLLAYTSETGITNLEFRVENKIVYGGI